MRLFFGKKKRWRNGCSKIIGAFLLFSAAASASAAEEGRSELEFFAHEAQTITASRRLQPVREAPVAVEVITGEEIRTSGATNLWDLLRFRVGVDVLDGRSVDGNRAIVSVRGFPEEFVDSLQVLVDGRSVYNAYSGGVYWEQLPVQLQDIERIEIVRGPNAALYGSNAALGVIHIITKKPSSERSASAYLLRGNIDLFQSGAAYESAGDRFGYRLSYGFWNEDGFHNAPSDPNPFFTIPPAEDFLTSHKTNLRGFWNPTDRFGLEFFAGSSWDEMGMAFEREGKFRNAFGMLKGSLQLGADSTLELMASYNKFTQKSEPDFEGTFEVDYTQSDVEAVHHINWGEGRLKTTWGGSYRLSVAESDEAFRSEPEQENALVRGFVQQSIVVIEALTVVAAASLERSDTGGTEPAYQIATLYALGTDHALRASYSAAPTVPSMWEARVDRQSDFTVIMEGNPDLKPSKLHSYEISYHGAYLDRRLQAEGSLFYMQFDDLTASFVKQEGSFFPFPTPTTFSFDNSREATAKGAELKWTYRFAPARSVYVNYTYETIDDDGSTFTEADRVLIEDATPKHKVNLGGIFRIAAGLSASVNAGYKSSYAITNSRQSEIVEVAPYWRVDARLAYNPIKDVEFFIGGKNLASPNHREFPDFLEIPKTYYGGVSVIY